MAVPTFSIFTLFLLQQLHQTGNYHLSANTEHQFFYPQGPVFPHKPLHFLQIIIECSNCLDQRWVVNICSFRVKLPVSAKDSQVNLP